MKRRMFAKVCEDKIFRTGFMAFALMLQLALCSMTMAQSSSDSSNVHAPELVPNMGWLNTTGPLRLSHELKGQVVLLDFWTYACINCMHILPDLAYLEDKYKNQPFQVIGVHSAKFKNESSSANIEEAIKRYGIRHPVVVDKQMAIWEKYSVHSWPTFILIDSRGYVVGETSGEGQREVLDKAVQQVLDEGRKNHSLASAPLHLQPTELMDSKSSAATTPLSFPGKILADAASKRLFIADSGHNRIVISTLPDASGKSVLLGVVGSGKIGSADGNFAAASFHSPQGMALKGDTLFVADTNNHLIRAIDLATSTVKTIAGTGQQGQDRTGGAIGTAQALNSPWDVALLNNSLIIAMAGTHQIWRMDLPSGKVQAWAGNGREDIVDGPLMEASFAQPSGLAVLHGHVYEADAEVSGIRDIDPVAGTVKTVVGVGLFDFGDIDGKGSVVRLQHAIGIAAWGDVLLVADTFNHKLKRIDPATKESKTVAGTGKPGSELNGKNVSFAEPSGVSVIGNTAFVADTNNNRVVEGDLSAGTWVGIDVSGLLPPK